MLWLHHIKACIDIDFIFWAYVILALFMFDSEFVSFLFVPDFLNILLGKVNLEAWLYVLK